MAEQSDISQKFPAQASSLRKGGYIIIRDRPCKIVEMNTSKPGKHGHAKINFIALDVFTGKKLEHVISSTHNVYVPNVTRVEYILSNISYDGYLSLLSDKGELKDDVKLPDDPMGKELQDNFDNGEEVLVNVLTAMGGEMVISFKIAPRRP